MITFMDFMGKISYWVEVMGADSGKRSLQCSVRMVMDLSTFLERVGVFGSMCSF